MIKKQFALGILCVLCSISIKAQDASDELGAWYILASNSKISEKISSRNIFSSWWQLATLRFWFVHN